MRLFRGIFVLAFVMFAVGSIASFAKGPEHIVYKLPPKKVVEYIDKTAGERRIIFIYASWCPYCAKKMPGIMDLERSKKNSVIAISVDESYPDFVRYLRRFNEIPFKIILNDSSEKRLADTFKKYGVEPWDGIPRIIFLNEDNEVVGQGNYTVEAAAEFISGK